MYVLELPFPSSNAAPCAVSDDANKYCPRGMGGNAQNHAYMELQLQSQNTVLWVSVGDNIL